MNKADLVDAVLAGGEVDTKAAAGRVVEGLLASMSKTLKKGDEVSIAGFGKFTVTKRAARTGRNPHTGETIKIKAKKVVKFKPATALKEAVA